MILLEARKGKEKIEFDLPEGYEELTWAQVNALAKLNPKQDNYLGELVAIITGVNPDFWRDVQDVDQYLTIEGHCIRVATSWATLLGKHEINYRPIDIKIGENLVSFPSEIMHETIGQYQDAIAIWSSFARDQDDWEKSPNGTPLPPVEKALDLYGKIFKIYADSQINTGYQWPRAEKLDIGKVPAIHVLGWAAFFLTSLVQLRNGTKDNAQGLDIRARKSKQGFRNWMSSLGSSSRWTA